MGLYNQASNEIKTASRGVGVVNVSQQEYIVYESNHFIFFDKAGFEENLTGFKIHVSVDAADVDKASDIIGKCVNKSQLGSFKIVAPDRLQKFSNPNEMQAGKIFTCYIDKDKMSPQEWNQFVNNVEYNLRGQGIRPGPSLGNGGDQLVKGSQYMGTRQSYYVMQRPDGSYKRAGEIPRDIILPKGYPNYGASLDVTPALNELSKKGVQVAKESPSMGMQRSVNAQAKSYSFMNRFEDAESHGKRISVINTRHMSIPDIREMHAYYEQRGIQLKNSSMDGYMKVTPEDMPRFNQLRSALKNGNGARLYGGVPFLDPQVMKKTYQDTQYIAQKTGEGVVKGVKVTKEMASKAATAVKSVDAVKVAAGVARVGRGAAGLGVGTVATEMVLNPEGFKTLGKRMEKEGSVNGVYNATKETAQEMVSAAADLAQKAIKTPLPVMAIAAGNMAKEAIVVASDATVKYCQNTTTGQKVKDATDLAKNVALAPNKAAHNMAQSVIAVATPVYKEAKVATGNGPKKVEINQAEVKKNQECFDKMEEMRQNLQAQNKQVDTSLHGYSSKNLDAFSRAVMSNPKSINGQDALGNTALHKAIAQNDMKMVETLVSNGADLNIKNQEGQSALAALKEKDPKIVGYIETLQPPKEQSTLKNNLKNAQEVAYSDTVSSSQITSSGKTTRC